MWMKNFPLACSFLLTPLEECQKAVDKALDEMQLEFTWLEEVENEEYKLFAVKRNKLEMMPKTPCQKTRGRKKTKRKLSEVDEEKENKNNLSYSKCVPSRLKFEEKRCGLKRPVEERGLSPCPKRTRSYQIEKPLDDQTSIINSPLRTEEKDILKSPRRSPRAFKFDSAQKKISGFTNRTPGFGKNTGRFFSFSKNTPQSRFLKRNSQSPLAMQIIQEQKKKKMLEKDARDLERIKRAAEMKKKKIEEMKRQREEKERKIAEIKEKKLHEEQEMKHRLNKKLVEQSALNEKIMEARLKEEKEKQKLRLKKQMEADARRRHEEEERQRKLAEQEKERIKQQDEERKQLALAEAQKLELKKLINTHNNTIKNHGNISNNPSVSLNNQSVNYDRSLNSYDLTPVKDKIYNVPNKDPNNYNIEDIGSDESTDDDEAPKKQIPKWATGIDLNVALIRHHSNPPDLFALFRPCCLEPPDLEKIFAGTKKRRYKERTSSAIWN